MLIGDLGTLVAALGVWALWFQPNEATIALRLMRTSILMPEGERLGSFRHAVAVSPHGRWVAYTSPFQE